jgi:hypothetical protein
MRRTYKFPLCAISLLGLTLSHASTVSLQTVKIADGVYQFITSPDGYVPNGNSVVIITEEDVVVFDTFTRPSTARLELAEIRKITSKPVALCHQFALAS